MVIVLGLNELSSHRALVILWGCHWNSCINVQLADRCGCSSKKIQRNSATEVSISLHGSQLHPLQKTMCEFLKWDGSSMIINHDQHQNERMSNTVCYGKLSFRSLIYPLVNVNITMENHHFP